jgi:hypothetical protein
MALYKVQLRECSGANVNKAAFSFPGKTWMRQGEGESHCFLEEVSVLLLLERQAHMLVYSIRSLPVLHSAPMTIRSHFMKTKILHLNSSY